MRPARTPIGLHLSQTARVVGRAFDDALAQAGGSVPEWLVLLNLKKQPQASQRDLAEAIGLREATVTHHLNAMDARGLLTRRRDPANRRVHLVELTDAGEAAFLRLRDAATSFDRQLGDGFTDTELDHLRGLLDRLAGNASTGNASTGNASTGNASAGHDSAAPTKASRKPFGPAGQMGHNP